MNHRRVLQEIQSKLFAEKKRPNPQKPIKCLSYTVKDDIIALAYTVLDKKKAVQFRRLFNEIESEVWERLIVEDKKLLELTK